MDNVVDEGTKSGAVTVRIASTPEDVDSFVKLARDSHHESRYRDVPYDPEQRRQVWQERIVDGAGNFKVFLAALDGRDVGILISTLGSYLFTDALQAQCYSLYVQPEHRGGLSAVKLLHAFKRWAELQGASSITVHVTSGVRLQSTDRLLRKLGYDQTGGNYEMRLDDGVPKTGEGT